jgi:hypothetical protein
MSIRFCGDARGLGCELAFRELELVLPDEGERARRIGVERAPSFEQQPALTLERSRASR